MVSGLTEATGIDGVYCLAAGEKVTGVERRLGAVRRLRQERRLGPRRGGRNLPARGVLAVFSKPSTYPCFTDPPKQRTGSSSTWWHRSKDFESKKEAPPSIEAVQRGAADPTGLTGPLDRSGRSSRV